MDRLVRCWTQRYRYYGYQTTSAVESTHAKCKDWLASSRGELRTGFKQSKPWWNKVERDLRFSFSKEATFAPEHLRSPPYEAVIRVITVHSLKEVVHLWQVALKII